MTQGKIERWHLSLKSRILLDNYYLPSDLQRAIAAFVEHYISAITRASTISRRPMSNLRLLVLALIHIVVAQVIERLGDIAVASAERLLADRQRPLKQIFCLRVLALVLIRDAKVHKCLSVIRIRRAELRPNSGFVLFALHNSSRIIAGRLVSEKPLEDGIYVGFLRRCRGDPYRDHQR
jgi:hypothetical protein